MSEQPKVGESPFQDGESGPERDRRREEYVRRVQWIREKGHGETMDALRYASASMAASLGRPQATVMDLLRRDLDVLARRVEALEDRQSVLSRTIAENLPHTVSTLTPGHTDLMISPEDLDAYLNANPPLGAKEDAPGGEEGEEWGRYRRVNVSEMTPWTPDMGTAIPAVSVSQTDRDSGSPKAGDMIARNPENRADMWLVAADYFAANFAPLGCTDPRPVLTEEVVEKATIAFHDFDLNNPRYRWENQAREVRSDWLRRIRAALLSTGAFREVSDV